MHKTHACMRSELVSLRPCAPRQLLPHLVSVVALQYVQVSISYPPHTFLGTILKEQLLLCAAAAVPASHCLPHTWVNDKHH